jgi:fructose-1,6-bisphosphatase/inositol monophosphatase family enzyme
MTMVHVRMTFVDTTNVRHEKQVKKTRIIGADALKMDHVAQDKLSFNLIGCCFWD